MRQLSEIVCDQGRVMRLRYELEERVLALEQVSKSILLSTYL